MLAVKEAQELIKNANINGIDHVYSINIPAEMSKVMDQTIVLITDANSVPTVYGNNDFNALRRMVEVQVFYSNDLDVDPEIVDVKLYRTFTKAGWDLGQNYGHTFDPDTNQLTTTFYVYNLEIL